MPQKSFNLPNVGLVTVVKRRGSRNIRLSVNANSLVRVSQPTYIPYSAGVAFALQRAEWIIKHLNGRPALSIQDGMNIGKSYQVKIIKSTHTKRPIKKLINNELQLRIPVDFSAEQTRKFCIMAIEHGLNKDSQMLLPDRINMLAQQYGYKFSELKIKKLTSRWGSCNNSKVITLSYYLIQLPWELIDYVLIHELVHTKHMHHKAVFWDEMRLHIPHLKEVRAKIQKYNPNILNL